MIWRSLVSAIVLLLAAVALHAQPGPTANPTIYTTTSSLPASSTLTRASTAWYWDSSGNLASAATDTARFTYNPATLALQGLLNEPAATNSLRNSSNGGAVAGTPGTAPTHWAVTGNVASVNREVVGTATVNGLSCTDLRWSGTPSGNATISIIFEASTQVAAQYGDTWVSSVFTSLVGGSLSNVTISNRIHVRNGAGSILLNSASAFVPTSAAPSTQRNDKTLTIATAGVAFVTNAVTIDVTSGNAMDVTLRVCEPQLVLEDNPSSPILTTTVAVTRAADVFKLPVPTGLYNVQVIRNASSILIGAAISSNDLYTVPTSVDPLQYVLTYLLTPTASGNYFTQAMIGSITLTGAEVIQQQLLAPVANDASTPSTYAGYPAHRYQVNAQMDGRAQASTWTNTPPGSTVAKYDFFLWDNRCTGAGCTVGKVPNSTPDTPTFITDGQECRLQYSTVERAQAATKAQALFAVGAPKTDGGGNGYEDVALAAGLTAVYALNSTSTNPDGLTTFSSVVNSICTAGVKVGFPTAIDVAVMPSGRLVDVPAGNIGAVTLDYESQDGRTTTQSTNYITDLATRLAAFSIGLRIYTNPLVGFPAVTINGLDASNLNIIANAVESFYIFLYGGTSCIAPGVDKYVNQLNNSLALLSGTTAVADCATGNPTFGVSGIPYTHLGILADLGPAGMNKTQSIWLHDELNAHAYNALVIFRNGSSAGGPCQTYYNYRFAAMLGLPSC